jgi:hypothetical protein
MFKCSKLIDTRESNFKFNLDDFVARPTLVVKIYTRLTLMVGKLVDQWLGTDLDRIRLVIG